MKLAIALILLVAIIAFVANAPLFAFAWFMTSRVFWACVACLVIGFIIAKL